jgi:two-component system, OmpR family, KDP operon response regulator KdpE
MIARVPRIEQKRKIMTPPPPQPRILIVDDEPAMRRMLRQGLGSDGYTLSECDRGMAALEAVRRRDTDMIILDPGLPDIDGLEVIKRIRYAQLDIPIIVLSRRADEAAKVAALDLGADDFITKPFGLPELRARIRALQRHRARPSTEQSVIEVGDLLLDLDLRTVTIRGVETRLSPREFSLLQLLATHAGKVLTHSFILRHVWGISTDVQYLRIYIRALRQKLEPKPQHPTLLVTEQGVGYRLRVPEPDVSGALLADAPVSALAMGRALSR